MRTKFLILRFSSIGDIVLTTPLLRCLKQQYPNAEIHYLTKPAFKIILENNPYISQVHVLDKPLLKKVLELKQTGFDYIIDLHNNLRTLIIKSAMDLPSFSFDKLNIEKVQLVNIKVNTLPQIHIVDRYLDTLSSFGVTNDRQGLDYFIPDDVTLSDKLKQLTSKPYIAFAIGAQHNTKRLPTQKLSEICKNIKVNVILLGGKEDEQTGKEIAETSGEHVINLSGKLSLHQSALVIKFAQKVITHDTGLMHIAAAFKKPIISIWGNTVPEFGMTPYYGNSNINQQFFEVNNLSCKPCSKIGFKSCPKTHFNCMNMQDTSAIAAAANKI
jgi:ADP-heptose:LPS heptosyltransferase